MKITLEIPDNTVLATVTLGVTTRTGFGLGTHNLGTEQLVDCATHDLTKQYKSEENDGT